MKRNTHCDTLIELSNSIITNTMELFPSTKRQCSNGQEHTINLFENPLLTHNSVYTNWCFIKETDATKGIIGTLIDKSKYTYIIVETYIILSHKCTYTNSIYSSSIPEADIIDDSTLIELKKNIINSLSVDIFKLNSYLLIILNNFNTKK